VIVIPGPAAGRNPESTPRDRAKPYLAKRWTYPHIVIHPDDAKVQRIESGDFVEVTNDTVYIQTGAPIGVEGADLTFTKLMETGHISRRPAGR
jgi:arsenite oxidase large subunit